MRCLSFSQGKQILFNLRRGPHALQIRIVWENYVKQARAFFRTEFVVIHFCSPLRMVL